MTKQSMKEYWNVGESCVLRGIVNNRVWSAQSVIVVRDKPEEIILLLLPGAQCAFPEGYWYWRLINDHSTGTRWQEATGERIVLREYTWQTNRILMFLEPEKYYSCYLIWDHVSGQFSCYYINFQLPYSRSHCGFDTLDLDLDIVIDPNYNWTWKDLEDYHNGVREGSIRNEWVNGVEQSQTEIFDRINKRIYPLDSSWRNWQPNRTWFSPTLIEKWQEI